MDSTAPKNGHAGPVQLNIVLNDVIHIWPKIKSYLMFLDALASLVLMIDPHWLTHREIGNLQSYTTSGFIIEIEIQTE